jgi:VWFA-related protein
MRGLRCFAFLVAACCGLSCVAQSSPAGQSADHVPTLQVQARAVVLDVVVTGKNGEPVPGLRAGDFRVTENGVPQRIDSFEEHSPQLLPQRPPQALPPDTFANLPSRLQGDSMNVVLLDGLNTAPADRSWMNNQVEEFLKNGHLHAPVAVFSLTSHLRLIHDFTTDSQALLESLTKNKALLWPDSAFLSRQTRDDANDVANLQMLQMMGAGLPQTGAVASIAHGQEEMKAQQLGQDRGLTLIALQALARYLAPLPGRKNLLWFADSYPVAFTPEARSGAGQSGSVTLNEMKRTTDLLADARISVYPISAGGVQGNSMMDASNSAIGPARQASAMQEQTRVDSAQSMVQMAQQTGGEALQNHNDLVAALGRAIANGEHYYTISYTPSDSRTEGLRRIEVQVGDPKDRLSYRRTYYAVNSAAASGEVNPLLRLLLKGAPEAMQLVFVARVSPEEHQPDPGAARAGGNSHLSGPVKRYKVDVLIPAAALPLIPVGDRHRAELDIDLVVWGADGRAANWAGGPVQVDLDSGTFATEQKVGLPWHLEVDAPENANLVKVGVYDRNTGRAGTIEVPLGDLQPLRSGGNSPTH